MAKLLGKAPNQVPTNADLGTMAFQDREGINVNNAIVANLVVTGATSVNTTFAVVNTSANVLFVAANGNIGIGNNTPTDKLRVEGIVSFLTSAAIGANVIANTTALFLGNSTVNTVITQTTASFNANTTYGTLVVAANGNVGIGHLAPTTRLMVNGAFRSVLSGQGDYIISHSGLVSTAGAVVGVQLALTGGGTEAIRIDLGANVGIGNTTPNAKLQVTGTANISGNVALGGTLTVAGNLTVSGTTTYINTTNLDIGDNIITLNADLGAVAPTEDAGFVINRGTSANVSFTWDETNDRWTFGGDGANNVVRQSSNTLVRTSFINSSGIWDYFGTPTTINDLAEFSIFNGVNRLDNRTRNYLLANSTANNVMFAANGNVGIGNMTPVNKFNVRATSNTQVVLNFLENNDTGTGAVAIERLTAGTDKSLTLYAAGGGYSGMYGTATAPTFYYDFDNHTFRKMDGTVLAVFAANGNVGIGNSTPGHKLRVEGTLSLGNSSSNVQITIPTSVIASATNYWLNANGQWAIISGVAAVAGGSNTHIQYNNSGAADGSAALTFNNTTNNVTVANTLIVGNTTVNSSISTTGASIGANSTTTALFVAANGNIGIGNATPGSKLTIAGATPGPITIGAWAAGYNAINLNGNNVGGAGGSDYSILGDASSLFINRASGSMHFRLNNNDQMLLAGNGNFGIGNTAPASALVVERNADSNIATMLVRNTTTGTAALTTIRVTGDTVGAQLDIGVASNTYGGYGLILANSAFILSKSVNGGIELGKIGRTVAGTPYIDFHSSSIIISNVPVTPPAVRRTRNPNV